MKSCGEDDLFLLFQSLNINNQQFQWILDHLGHTANVHREHYRAMSDVIERVEVAKLLLIQDLGLVGKYNGQRLQDITLEGKEFIIVSFYG